MAVLPFQNLGGDPAKEYFSDGMTEEVIARLSEIQPAHLGVIARASSMTYKNTQKDLKQICRELGVDYVLEGGVLLISSRARINTQLIQCSDETQAWADTDERDLANVLALQNSVADGVASNVRLVLDPPSRSRLASSRPIDAEAYQIYLKGRHMWEKLSPDANRSAISFFQAAIAKDPAFAKAYVGLADSYMVEAALGGEPPTQPFFNARTAAAKALALEDAQAEAHAALGQIAVEYDWDWTAGEHELRRALDLNPNLVVPHVVYWRLLRILGRRDEAAAQLKAAHELDPVSPIVGTVLVQDLYFSRRYSEAIAQAKEFGQLFPDSMGPYFTLADVYYAQGASALAAETYLKGLELAGEAPQRLAALSEANSRSGILGFWKKKLELDLNPGVGRYVRPFDVAYDYAALDDRDHSFRWLDQAAAAKDPLVTEFHLRPQFDLLQQDPRFGELLRKMNLPQ